MFWRDKELIGGPDRVVSVVNEFPSVPILGPRLTERKLKNKVCVISEEEMSDSLYMPISKVFVDGVTHYIKIHILGL